MDDYEDLELGAVPGALVRRAAQVVRIPRAGAAPATAPAAGAVGYGGGRIAEYAVGLSQVADLVQNVTSTFTATRSFRPLAARASFAASAGAAAGVWALNSLRAGDLPLFAGPGGVGEAQLTGDRPVPLEPRVVRAGTPIIAVWARSAAPGAGETANAGLTLIVELLD